ncbi:hypothetical protein ACIRRA_42345 [Nocardia sp. NPDC101769]|uniref:hypothetical protein n=1 Tax=Nocardia sp. NPDC101769 TaxID=3364333 RepID=UPI0037F6345E
MTTRAQRRTETVLQRVADRLLSDVPAVAAGDGAALLAEAHVDMSRTIRQVDTYLASHPDGLTAPGPDCPAGILRLTRLLAAKGYPVTPPPCASCGHHRDLAHQSPAGRICSTCHFKGPGTTICTACGRTRRPVARYGDTVLCSSCYRSDSRLHRECSGCGRMRTPDSRSSEGRPLCQGCAERPRHRCIDCGQDRPAHARTATGPVCKTCYRRSHLPRRRCGRCGLVKPIAVRAIGAHHPDLCDHCWYLTTHPRPAKPAPRAKNLTAHQPPKPALRQRAPGEPRPKGRTYAACCFCGRHKLITVTWPIGPVCAVCYPRAKEHPASCADCERFRILIGKNTAGQPICGPCSGSRFDYQCTWCGQAGRNYMAGRCFRCCVEVRLQAMLGDTDGRIPDHLVPLTERLLAAEKPRSVLIWLRKSTAAQLLADLAATGEPITHALLDQQPPARAVEVLRAMLTHSGILPERLDHLDRLTPWLDALLESAPTHHARLIRPYAQWHLLHRARRRAHRRGTFTVGSSINVRRTIRTALQFLGWLDDQQIDLAAVTQHDIDAWLIGGTSRRYLARYFLHWAAGKHLAPAEIIIPAPKSGQPKTFSSYADHVRQLDRCLHDSNLPVDVRAAGALILLFGLRTTEVITLRADQLVEDASNRYLRIGDRTIPLPPLLADLLQRLPVRRPGRHTVLAPYPAAAKLLFPGFSLSKPIYPDALGNRLLRHGIAPKAGRNTARATLAADLPAPILASIAGIADETAANWTLRARRDWNGYIALRAADRPDISPRN